MEMKIECSRESYIRSDPCRNVMYVIFSVIRKSSNDINYGATYHEILKLYDYYDLDLCDMILDI